jgi:oligoribonuclease NrnB/cAMP/cGMP phosphodiesterase (DHH superfamily)
MKYLILYHGNCFDGFCSAYVARQGLKNSGQVDNVTIMPVFYGNPPPYDKIDSDTKVYVLDFSYNDEQLLWMTAALGAEVSVIDHHEPAFKRMAGVQKLLAENNDIVDNLYLKLDGKKSGAGLAWDHFIAHSPAIAAKLKALQSLVAHVQDRDLWDFKLPDTKKFMINLASQPMDFETWDRLVAEWDASRENYTEFVKEGEAQLRLFNNQIEELLTNKALVVGEIDGFTVATVGADNMFASELGNRLCAKYDLAIIWVYDTDKGKYYLSLRTLKDGPVDVSKIAEKHFNGGGHKAAAGGNTDKHLFWKDENGPIKGKRIERFRSKSAGN